MAAVERPRIVPAPAPADPHISIVLPIYNAQAILHASVVDLRERLKPLGWSYEIILAENGSKDRTIEIGHELAAKYGDPRDGQVKIISMGEPNYGKALKQGILLARGDVILCDEIDLCDTDFHKRAVDILETGEVDLVIGSPLAAGAAPTGLGSDLMGDRVAQHGGTACGNHPRIGGGISHTETAIARRSKGEDMGVPSS